MERVPLVGSMLEVVGFYVSLWFSYRMISSPEEREEVISNLKSLTDKIIGNDKE